MEIQPNILLEKIDRGVIFINVPDILKAMVNVQMLSELEEVIQYKLVSERREAIKTAWWNRLQGCQANVEEWHRILQVHSLILTPQEDMKTWLKYASLCRKSGQLV